MKSWAKVSISHIYMYATSLIYHAVFTPIGFRHFNVDCCAYNYIMRTHNGFKPFCAVCIFLQNSFASLKKFRNALRKSAALAAPTYRASVIVESCSSSCTELIARRLPNGFTSRSISLLVFSFMNRTLYFPSLSKRCINFRASRRCSICNCSSSSSNSFLSRWSPIFGKEEVRFSKHLVSNLLQRPRNLNLGLLIAGSSFVIASIKT